MSRKDELNKLVEGVNKGTVKARRLEDFCTELADFLDEAEVAPYSVRGSWDNGDLTVSDLVDLLDKVQ